MLIELNVDAKIILQWTLTINWKGVDSTILLQDRDKNMNVHV
jgi:hypothetical protein